MQHLRLLRRLIYINLVLAKHGLDEIVTATGWLAPIRFIIYLNPWNWFRDKETSRGTRIRETLEELGPIFVKFGQTLSTRPDLLPEDITNELSKLQDNVKPFGNVKAIIASIYGPNVEQLFTHFDYTPLAAASIAQVHPAILPDGQEVVVKILRPNIKKAIKRDIALLYAIAHLVERYWSGSRRFKPNEVIREFEHSLLNELDLMREAANASQLRRNFQDSNHLYIPEVFWQHCRDRAIVFERIHGIPILDTATLERKQFNMKKLAERGVEIFFTQVFRDCFFHADMHPGNLFINPEKPDDPQYIAVDFGIVGTLNPTDQRYLAENILAFFKRDYRRVAQLHIDSRWVHPNTRVDEFESAIRTVCEPIFGRPLKDISCGQLLLRLLQTGKQFNMEIQPQLLLLQKTLLHVEGLGRQLYPELDLWSTAQPFLERWIKQRMGLRSSGKNLMSKLPFLLEKAPEVPELLYQALQHFKQQELRQYTSAEEAYEQSATIKKNRKSSFTLGFALALLFSGSMSYVIAENSWGYSTSLASIGIFLALAGFFILFIRFFIPKQ